MDLSKAKFENSGDKVSFQVGNALLKHMTAGVRSQKERLFPAALD
jgi:hypothetical protein